jgi:hypothetical protein
MGIIQCEVFRNSNIGARIYYKEWAVCVYKYEEIVLTTQALCSLDQNAKILQSLGISIHHFIPLKYLIPLRLPSSQKTNSCKKGLRPSEIHRKERSHILGFGQPIEVKLDSFEIEEWSRTSM